jgi:hypothetical protein
MRERLPIALLIGALTDQEQVYYATQKALASPGEAVSAEMLMALTHEQKLLRRTLATAQHLHIHLPVDFLLAHLGEASHGPYNNAADLLVDLGERAPLTTLPDMMRDSSAQARLGAARALSQLAPYVPAEPLFALLPEIDPTEESYSFLVLSLLRKGEHVPVEIVMQALKREWHGAYEEDRMISLALGLEIDILIIGHCRNSLKRLSMWTIRDSLSIVYFVRREAESDGKNKDKEDQHREKDSEKEEQSTGRETPGVFASVQGSLHCWHTSETAL